ncbi:MAG: hypothetical protein LBB62_03210, partial [Proteiniphilum sp.]|nr:hypothetical protein [Proteiniphilum sp.]
SDKGKKLLIEFINEILDYLFKIKSEEEKIVKIAESLLESGVDEDIIAKSTKLPKQRIKELKKLFDSSAV